MSNGLSADDLSFFDSHSSASAVVAAKPPVAQPGTDDDDDFGDFVQSEGASDGPAASIDAGFFAQPQTSLQDWPQARPAVQPQTRPRVEARPAPQIEGPDLLGLTEDRPPQPSAEEEMKAAPQQLRFGQTSRGGSFSQQQWHGILDSTQGPKKSIAKGALGASLQRSDSAPSRQSPARYRRGDHVAKQGGDFRHPPRQSVDRTDTRQNEQSLEDIFGPAPAPSLARSNSLSSRQSPALRSSPGIPLKQASPQPLSPKLAGKPSPRLPPQPTPESDDSDFDDFDDFKSSSAVPPAHELLAQCRTNVLPMASRLQTELAPLPFALKRRVLANPKTKDFVSGYLESISVVARIIAGRARRSLTAEQTKLADREARHFESDWTALRPRIMSLAPASTSVPSIDSRAIFSAKASASVCDVCGLAKNESLKNQPRPIWTDGGHKTCLAFWNNKSAFGL